VQRSVGQSGPLPGVGSGVGVGLGDGVADAEAAAVVAVPDGGEAAVLPCSAITPQETTDAASVAATKAAEVRWATLLRLFAISAILRWAAASAAKDMQVLANKAAA
jgi:hypothetical protein